MGRKKNPENNYFHEGVEKAILDYNVAETQYDRDRLFRIIYPALSKIAQVYYNKIKPTYVNGEPLEIQMNCICYLTERLDKIKQGKGKAFSYMTVCAKNYYIQQNMFAYANLNKVKNTSELPEGFDMVDVQTDRLDEMEKSSNLLNAFAQYLETNIELISTPASRKSKPIINKVIDMIKNIDNIENFNRRDIMNGLVLIDGMKIDRHYVTTVFNRLTIHYQTFKKEFNKTGESIEFWNKNSLTKEESEFCIKHYKSNNRKTGIIALAKKFGVDDYAVRRELRKAGIASI